MKKQDSGQIKMVIGYLNSVKNKTGYTTLIMYASCANMQAYYKCN